MSILDKIKERYPLKDAVYLPRHEILRHIVGMARPKDMVITLGAGDISKLSDELAEEFKK